jgi:FG-GAP-like repeat
MKIIFNYLILGGIGIFYLIGIQTLKPTAQKSNYKSLDTTFFDFSKTLILEYVIDTTANVSFGDFDADGHLDVLLVKGRHWPIVDRVLLGDGLGGIKKSYNLGEIADRSYTGGLADFNGDGLLDIAVSNDAPDQKLVYYNDGTGNFTIGSTFGHPKWPTRNLSIVDVNLDGLPDLILANRGRAPTYNYICLNMGGGKFNADCIPFAPYPSTTITPLDLNKDGNIDFLVPHRNGGQSYVYIGSPNMVYSDSIRIPFGSANSQIRTAAVADFNGDNLLDIVAIDEIRGVNIYFGQKDNTFSEGTSLSDLKMIPYAMTIADLNNDNKMEIIVGHVKSPSLVFYKDGASNKFKSISFGDANGTVYGFAVADFNEDGILDIAAARSEATNILYFGSVKAK